MISFRTAIRSLALGISFLALLATSWPTTPGSDVPDFFATGEEDGAPGVNRVAGADRIVATPVLSIAPRATLVESHSSAPGAATNGVAAEEPLADIWQAKLELAESLVERGYGNDILAAAGIYEEVAMNAPFAWSIEAMRRQDSLREVASRVLR